MLYSADDDISSISGSDSESSDTSDSDGDANSSELSRHRGHCLASRQRRQLLLRNPAGQLFAIQRCVVDVNNVSLFTLIRVITTATSTSNESDGKTCTFSYFGEQELISYCYSSCSCSFACAFYSASAWLAMQSAVLAIVNLSVSVCPSVCPSHAGTVSKRLKLRSWVFTGG